MSWNEDQIIDLLHTCAFISEIPSIIFVYNRYHEFEPLQYTGSATQCFYTQRKYKWRLYRTDGLNVFFVIAPAIIH